MVLLTLDGIKARGSRNTEFYPPDEVGAWPLQQRTKTKENQHFIYGLLVGFILQIPTLKTW